MKSILAIYVNHQQNEILKTTISPFFDTIEEAANYLKQENIDEDSIINCDFIAIHQSNSIMNSVKRKKSLIPIVRFRDKEEDLPFFDEYEYAFIDQSYKRHTQDKDYFKKELKGLIKKARNNKYIGSQFEYIDDNEVEFDKNYIYFNTYKYNKHKPKNVDFPDYLQECIEFYYDFREMELEIENDINEFLMDESDFDIVEDTNELPSAELNREFLYMSHPEWHDWIEVFDQFLTRNDLFYTVTHTETHDTGTFGNDNKMFLYHFINSHLHEESNDEFFIEIRKFTKDKEASTGLPIKKTAAAVISKGGFHTVDIELLKSALRKENPRDLKLGSYTFVTFSELLDDLLYID